MTRFKCWGGDPSRCAKLNYGSKVTQYSGQGIFFCSFFFLCIIILETYTRCF